MSDIKDLANYFDEILEEVKHIKNELPKIVAMKMISYVVYNMPTDTSNALSGWQISFNKPASKDKPAYFVGIAGSTLNVSAEATIRQARLTLKKKIDKDIIHLSNLTPYITYINDGTEKIPAYNFVEAMVITGELASFGNLDIVRLN